MAIKKWVNDYSAMQGPCPNGFHVPCREELDEMVSIMESFGFTEDNDYITKLKVPFAGYRNSWREGIVDVGEGARLVSSTPFDKGVYNISFFGRGPGQYLPDDRCVGWSIRPFSNIPVLPDSTRTTIYQGQGNSGIFHNTTDGIISLSANGKRWITITDKNLGATQVYNNGDTLSESNCGKFYQWGNNYGFPWEGAVTISNNKVDTTGYGPGNYYNNGVYIIPSYPYDRSISQNDNLRGGTTPTLKEQEIKSLRTNPTYSSMQGPCPNGYHVPSIDEITALKDAMEGLGLTIGDNRRVYLKMPFVGEINTSAQSKGMGSRTMLWTVDEGGTTYSGRVMRITATTVIAGPSSRAYGNMIRPFKNELLIPDNTWTVVYQGTGGAGIFHNATEGVISVSSNGTNWITIADKNLGATTVYNDGDTLSNANSGHYYQRGNNYGFNGPDGPVPQTDPTQVDASNYGPGNYYSSSIFITGNNDRSSVQNDNLWGGIYTPIKKVVVWKNGEEKQIRPEIIPAGIYHSATLGLITISDGNGNDITIADKNLGASTVYNDGDTLSEANCGKLYQWGNNYGFPYTGTVTSSTTAVDASNYGPGNYYNSSTFINLGLWDSSQNLNLWGGVTGTNEAMQGPCATGFHVPSKNESEHLFTIVNNWGFSIDDFCTYLKIPLAGFRDADSTYFSGTIGNYWTSTARETTSGYRYSWNIRYGIDISGNATAQNGFSIRPFKNEVVAPDNTWTKLYEKITPLCFTANTAGSKVQLHKSGNPTSVNIEISTDGTTWTDYTIGHTITLANVGDKVYMRNKSETATKFSTNAANYYHFALTGSVGCGGDISYLICKNGYQTMDYNYMFANLFQSCSSLTSCPKLPFTETPQGCYYGMFEGCTNLETLPKIQTSQTNSYCFYRMFYRCTKIKISQTQTGEYQTPYRVPTTGNAGLAGTDSMTQMFDTTGGTFTGLGLNTTYYTSNQVI